MARPHQERGGDVALLAICHDGGRSYAAGRDLVGARLREIGVGVEDALATADHGDCAATLQGVRVILGRATVARTALERLTGSHPTAANLPPLVRAVQAVGRLISDREIDGLPPDELRARMHAVLQALDHELLLLLRLSDETSDAAGEFPGVEGA